MSGAAETHGESLMPWLGVFPASPVTDPWSFGGARAGRGLWLGGASRRQPGATAVTRCPGTHRASRSSRPRRRAAAPRCRGSLASGVTPRTPAGPSRGCAGTTSGIAISGNELRSIISKSRPSSSRNSRLLCALRVARSSCILSHLSSHEQRAPQTISVPPD